MKKLIICVTICLATSMLNGMSGGAGGADPQREKKHKEIHQKALCRLREQNQWSKADPTPGNLVKPTPEFDSDPESDSDYDSDNFEQHFAVGMQQLTKFNAWPLRKKQRYS